MKAERNSETVKHQCLDQNKPQGLPVGMTGPYIKQARHPSLQERYKIDFEK